MNIGKQNETINPITGALPFSCLPVVSATHRISILTWSAAPDSTGGVFIEPFKIQATVDVWKRLVVVFGNNNAREGIAGGFSIPKNYVGTANLVVVWTSSATTDTVRWEFDYRAVGGNDAESYDQTLVQQAVTVDDRAPSATFERMEITIALTDGNFAVDDDVEFEFFRDSAEASDALADEVLLFQLFFEYNDA